MNESLRVGLRDEPYSVVRGMVVVLVLWPTWDPFEIMDSFNGENQMPKVEPHAESVMAVQNKINPWSCVDDVQYPMYQMKSTNASVWV